MAVGACLSRPAAMAALIVSAVACGHESFRDARIRAAFAIAPVLGPVMTKTSLADIRVPVRIVVGSKDDQAAPDVNARPIAATIPNAELEVIPGARCIEKSERMLWRSSTGR